MRRAVLAATLSLFAASARAESPRWGSFEIGAGTYRPDIDSEFDVRPGPFEQVFGTGRGWMFRLGAAKTLYRRAGSLELGLQSGYHQKSGKGLAADGGARTGDDTTFSMIPLSLALTYRADFLAERYKIPLAPYGRAALERFNWWVSDAGGDRSGHGATHGWSVTGGVALLLDIIDRQTARELDNDLGVNHTYLFFEVTRRTVDDFGSASSWDMSDENVGYNGGLLLVF